MQSLQSYALKNCKLVVSTALLALMMQSRHRDTVETHGETRFCRSSDRRDPGFTDPQPTARDRCGGKAEESARSVARNTCNGDKKEAAPRRRKWRRRGPRPTCGYESFFLRDSSGPCIVFKHRLIRKHDKRQKAIKTYPGCSVVPWNAAGIVFRHGENTVRVITGPGKEEKPRPG
ncbi:hypothetical protein K0M31_010829 [Melipona bicolor]|uniref:Uncharacterized protein n=1 Tax=Melipona bicolor TaxID=60889 RepID=A0AA40FKY5_9HYME|nr:hypothetical protein K0M31_010829 [Melipona bicolor]